VSRLGNTQKRQQLASLVPVMMFAATLQWAQDQFCIPETFAVQGVCFLSWSKV